MFPCTEDGRRCSLNRDVVMNFLSTFRYFLAVNFVNVITEVNGKEVF